MREFISSGKLNLVCVPISLFAAVLSSFGGHELSVCYNVVAATINLIVYFFCNYEVTIEIKETR